MLEVNWNVFFHLDTMRCACTPTTTTGKKKNVIWKWLIFMCYNLLIFFRKDTPKGPFPKAYETKWFILASWTSSRWWHSLFSVWISMWKNRWLTAFSRKFCCDLIHMTKADCNNCERSTWNVKAMWKRHH